MAPLLPHVDNTKASVGSKQSNIRYQLCAESDIDWNWGDVGGEAAG
jgi:hypothetical protein